MFFSVHYRVLNFIFFMMFHFNLTKVDYTMRSIWQREEYASWSTEQIA